jgi:hypothetical protein
MSTVAVVTRSASAEDRQFLEAAGWQVSEWPVPRNLSDTLRPQPQTLFACRNQEATPERQAVIRKHFAGRGEAFVTQD